MGVFENIPYTNFHEANQDWLIKTVKSAEEQSADAVEKAEQAVQKSEQTEKYVNTYFENLDVQQEINTKLDEMASDGSLGAVTEPYIPPVVTDWLDENIKQPSQTVIDASLTVEGAAADAKAAGDGISLDRNLLVTAVNGSVEFESGSFMDGDGHTKQERTDRIRCKNPIAKNAFFRIQPPTGYSMYTFYLDRNYNKLSVRTWSTAALDNASIPDNAEFLNIVFRNTSNQSGDISGEVNTVQENILLMPTYDTTVNMKKALSSADNLDDIQDLGTYYMGRGNMPVNSPTEWSSFMVVYGYGRSGGARTQVVYCYTLGTTKTYIRYLTASSTWTDWETVPYSRTGEYANLDDVMQYLSDIRRGGTLTSEDDLDTIVAHGMYYYNAADLPGHAPFNYNSLVQVFGGTSTASSIIQRAYSYTTNHEGSAIRYLYQNRWSEWTYDNASADNDSYVSGAAVNVRYPLNDTWSSADPNPYTYHKKVVTLAHFSDVHGHAQNFSALMTWANNHRSFFDDMLCTGDLVEYYNEQDGAGTYMDFWNDTLNADKILVTIGNHDAKNEQSSSHERWIRKSVARSRELYMSGIDNWDVVSPAGKTWWYKDYNNSDLRLIGLDTTVVTGSADDSAQLTWLENTLNSARTAGKSVVIAEHYQPADGGVVPSDFTATNRPIWSTSYLRMADSYHVKVQTFINAGGKFICWLAGHTHTDFVAYNTNYPDQVFIVVTSLWNDLRTSDQARTAGTPSFIAANLIGFDTDRKLIKIARIGANYDYNLRPREILVYNYENKQIVRQTSGD